MTEEEWKSRPTDVKWKVDWQRLGDDTREASVSTSADGRREVSRSRWSEAMVNSLERVTDNGVMCTDSPCSTIALTCSGCIAWWWWGEDSISDSMVSNDRVFGSLIFK